MPVLLLTQLFIVNLVSSRQLIQSSYIKLIKVQRYLFTAVLMILVQLFVFKYQAKFSCKIILKCLFSYYQKSLINYIPRLKIIILSTLQSLYILLIKLLTNSSIKSPVTRIRCCILVRRSIIIKIYLYTLPQCWHTSSVIIQLIEILVYRRAGSFSGFKKLGGVKQGVLV